MSKPQEAGKEGGFCSICVVGHCYAKWAHLLPGTIFCAMIKKWAGHDFPCHSVYERLCKKPQHCIGIVICGRFLRMKGVSYI